MRPEDVPADLVEKGARAMWNAQTRQPWQQIDDGDEWPSWVDLATRDRLREKFRHGLAAVLPDYRKQVIEEVATAIERSDSRRFPGRGWDFQYAAALRNYAHEDE